MDVQDFRSLQEAYMEVVSNDLNEMSYKQLADSYFKNNFNLNNLIDIIGIEEFKMIVCKSMWLALSFFWYIIVVWNMGKIVGHLP